jgi:hypothetical protein
MPTQDPNEPKHWHPQVKDKSDWGEMAKTQARGKKTLSRGRLVAGISDIWISELAGSAF